MGALPRPHLLFNPGPTNVHDDVRRCLLAADINHRDKKFCDLLATVRAEITDMMELSETHVCIPFFASGTGANEAVLGHAGGTLAVLVAGRYSERLAAIGEQLGLPVVRIEFDPLTGIDPSVVESELAKYPAVTQVCVVHHETTTGVLAPMARLSDIAGRFGVKLVVDGISSIFGHARDAWAPKVDYYTVTSNKCLESVPGLTFVIVRQSLISGPRKRSHGYYFDLARQWHDMEELGAPSFTQGYTSYLAAAAALCRLRLETVLGRSSRYNRLRSRLAAGFASMGIEPVFPKGERASWLQLFRRPVDMDFGLLRRRLDERNISIYTDQQTLSKGHMYFATMGAIEDDDVDILLNAIHDELPGVQRDGH